MLRAAALALLFAGLLAGCGQTDAAQPPQKRNLPPNVDPAWVHYTEPEVQVGDLAPDFELVDARGAGAWRLSELRGSPVLLVFASYT